MGKGRVTDTDLVRVAGTVIQPGVQSKRLPGFELNGAVAEFADADLGPLQVRKDGDMLLSLFRAAANGAGGFAVGVGAAVGKIQAENIHAGGNQVIEHGLGGGGGANSGHDFGATGHSAIH